MWYDRPNNKLVSLGIYLGFIALTIYYMLFATWTFGWRDAPQFVAAIEYLDISHPAGFPLLALIAKPFTWLPLGSIAFRVNLFCACSTVGALFILYRLIVLAGLQSYAGKPYPALTRWLAFILAMGFGLTPALWQSTVEIEAYSLNLIFLGLVIGCYLKHLRTPGLSWLMAGAFIYGLGLGNHAALALYVPGLLILAWGAPKDQPEAEKPSAWFVLLGIVFFCLLGLSVYAYLPLRTNPGLPINFGSPDDWERFWNHVSDQKDRSSHFHSLRESGRFLLDARTYLFEIIPRSFWVLGLPLVLLGSFFLWLRQPRLVLGLLAIICINSLFFITWTDGAGLLPSFYLAFLLIGVGLIFISRKLADYNKEPVKPALWAVLTIFLLLSGGWWRWQRQDNLGAYLSLETFWNELAQAPPEALMISTKGWFHNRALTSVYRLREDVFIVGGPDLIEPKYFNPVTAERYPGLALPPEPQNRLQPAVYMAKLIKTNLEQGRRVILELDRNFTLESIEALNIAVVPAQGLAMEAVAPAKLESLDVSTLARRQINYALKKLELETLESSLPYVIRAKSYYGSIWSDLAMYYNHYLNLPREALLLIDSCLVVLDAKPPVALSDHDKKVGGRPLMVAVEALWALGRFEEAEARMLNYLAAYNEDEAMWTDLARFYHLAKKPGQAEAAAKMAVKLAPRDPLANQTLAEILKEAGHRQEAVEHYRLAIENYNPLTEGRKIIRLQREAAFLLRGPKSAAEPAGSGDAPLTNESGK